MFQSCAYIIVVLSILALQWMVVMFYSKLKFKHRYIFATILSLMTTSVTLFLIFNCSETINNEFTVDQQLPKQKSLLRHVRDVKPEVRELLVENDRTRHTVNIKKGYHYSNENKEQSEEAENVVTEGATDILEQLQEEIEEIIDGEQDTKFHTTDQQNAETESMAEEDEPTNESMIDEQSENNLLSNIYNNVSETVLTIKEYIEIAHYFPRGDTTTTILPDYVITEGFKDWEMVVDKLPLSPDETLRRFGQFLPWWEHFEILPYTEVYFIGIGANKTQFVNSVKGNFGFDHAPSEDEEAGIYKSVIGDHIAYRYEVIKFLGSGSYGSVLQAFDHKTQENVAIKLMMNEKDWDDRYIKREMEMILKIENESQRKTYFPKVHSHFMFRNHKCIVMELLGESIHRRYRNSKPIKDMELIKRLTRDILNGVLDLHQMNIIHGDLKPDNIMYMPGKNNQSKGELLKVGDFGLACMRDSRTFKCPEYYIQTRYYRAPEVILSLPFNVSADVWSVGMIVAEMYNGNPIFWGESETDQLASMMEVLGLLPPFMVEQSPRKEVYQDAVCYKTKNGFKRLPYRKPLEKVALQNAPKEFIDFVKRCLMYDANLRITAKEALKHPFVIT